MSAILCWLHTYSDAITAFCTFLLFLVTFGLVLVAARQDRTIRRQLRAYVGVDEMPDPERRVVDFYPPRKEEGTMEAHAIAKNFGATPALRVKTVRCFKYLEGLPTGDMFPAIEFTGQATVHPGNSLFLRFEERESIQTYEVIKYDVGRTHTPPKFLYAFEYVSYFDVFNKPHWTRFCFRVQYRNGSDRPGWILEGPYNDTDDDYPQKR